MVSKHQFICFSCILFIYDGYHKQIIFLKKIINIGNGKIFGKEDICILL